jgi:Dual specificity phosphatase, catalytic domain
MSSIRSIYANTLPDEPSLRHCTAVIIMFFSSRFNCFSCLISLADICKVHCVYGQSRSAAVIVAYLLSLGESIKSAIDLLKEKRQIICINPGFLAQLFLLSAKGFQAPEIQLILQNPIRYDCTILSSAGNATGKQNLAKLQSLDYVDSYKIVSGGKKRLLGGTYVEDGPDSNSCIGERLPDIDLSLCADTASEGKVNIDCSATVEELTCAKCGFILAREANIIRATQYADFLLEHTDSYWAGYRPIHPSHEGVIALESTQLIEEKRTKQNNETKVRGRSEGLKAAQKCVTISVVGPMEWITEQIKSRRKDKEKQAPQQPTVRGGASKHAAASEGGADGIKLTCPSCRNTCGYCVRGGLEVCQSFLRCDLLALTSPTIKRTQRVMVYPAAQLLDPEV